MPYKDGHEWSRYFGTIAILEDVANCQGDKSAVITVLRKYNGRDISTDPDAIDAVIAAADCVDYSRMHGLLSSGVAAE